MSQVDHAATSRNGGVAVSSEQSKALKGKDLIFIGIYSAIYFVLNFACMLVSGFHPMIWILMPALIALLTGIPFMLMCAKVPKAGAVLIMGLITSLIYFVTGMFTPLILGMMIGACVIAEIIRAVAKYRSFIGNTTAFAFFSLGMCGSPLPIWVFHDSFFAQIATQGIAPEYLSTLEGLSTMPVLALMVAATIVCAIIGALIAKVLFKKHFERAGIV